MTAIVARLKTERAERTIDIGVFALGAASLLLALAVTFAGTLV